jgi:fructokinase
MGLIGAVKAGGTKFVLAVARADGTIVDRSRMDTRDAGITGAIELGRQALEAG